MKFNLDQDIRATIRWIGWFAVLVLAVGTIRGKSSIGAYFKLRESARRLEAAVATLEQENRDMRSEIERIRSSKVYARKVLRDKYHVTDGDEKIIFFTE